MSELPLHSPEGLALARRAGTQVAMLVIDLDGFKEVNDTLGHHAGDLLLQQVAGVFKDRIRTGDTVARTGGDEFSVVLEEPTSREEAELVGHSLVQMLAEPLELGKHTVRIGASVGIAVFPEDAREMESLCIAADLRMYDAKHLGRGPAESPRPPRAVPRMEPRPRAGLQVVD